MVRQVTTVNVDWILTEKGKDFGGFLLFSVLPIIHALLSWVVKTITI